MTTGRIKSFLGTASLILLLGTVAVSTVYCAGSAKTPSAPAGSGGGGGGGGAGGGGGSCTDDTADNCQPGGNRD